MAIKVWGLTGGVASGKSTVAKLFADAGVPVLDADQLARELNAPGGRAHAAILARFGTADRAKLREIVFKDASARAELEAIVHPLIREESARRIAEFAAAGAKLVIYEAALLVETGRYREMAGLIVVDAAPEVRRARLIARDRIDARLADDMIAAQIADEARRKAANVVITNHGSIEDLRAQVAEFLKRNA